jgi:transcriptional regulator with XRE-family HTH domain
MTLGGYMRETGNPGDALVSARIRIIRKHKKMSQSDLGKAINVTFQQVQKYGTGKNRVGASRLVFVADALGVPITDLFGDVAQSKRSAKATKLVAFDSQALRLAEAFAKISDKEVRTSLVDLAERYGEEICRIDLKAVEPSPSLQLRK